MKFSQLIINTVSLISLSSVVNAEDQQPLKSIKVKENPPLLYSNGDLHLENIYAELNKCSVVAKINELQAGEHENHEESIIHYTFSKLFPFEDPVYNSLLATTYISTLPTFTLAFFSSNINPASLNLLVSFAAGGILGDCFFHLLPQVFLGESVDHSKVSLVLVDEKRNVILGLFIFIGFLFFFIIDKSLRILQHGSESSGHSHSHSSHADDVALKTHKKTDGDKDAEVPAFVAKVDNSAYLNIISDFTHNITDGLAMSTSFFISKSTGSITCLGQVIHEIPHQVGDMALLIQGGFSKWQAIGVQFFTASGAFIGTFLGIFIQQLAKNAAGSELFNNTESPGLFGTTVTSGDLTLPFTAGGFIYVATVNVIPEVLELYDHNTKSQEAWNGVFQTFFILLGISMMFLVSWFE